MEVEKETEKNISKKSKISIQEFNQKLFKSNIRLHRVFLIICIIINIILLIFIILFNKKISSIKEFEKETNFFTFETDKKFKEIGKTLSQKFVNIIFHCIDPDLCFSNSFSNIKEYDTLIENLGKINKNIQKKKSFILAYKNIFVKEADKKYEYFIENSFFSNPKYFIVISTNGGKYGIYIWSDKEYEEEFPIYFNKNESYFYSFNTNKLYEYNGNSCALQITKTLNIIVGDNDFILYQNFKEDGAVINSPLSSFKDIDNFTNTLENNGKFEVRSLEIFYLFDNI